MSGKARNSQPNDSVSVTPDDDDNATDNVADIVPEKEIGGRDGPEPTRYGDWEKKGRCIDF